MGSVERHSLLAGNTLQRCKLWHKTLQLLRRTKSLPSMGPRGHAFK